LSTNKRTYKLQSTTVYNWANHKMHYQQPVLCKIINEDFLDSGSWEKGEGKKESTMAKSIKLWVTMVHLM